MKDYEFDLTEAEAENGAASSVAQEVVDAGDVDPLHGPLGELREACEIYGRELVREVFDSLEEHIVRFYATLRVEVSARRANARSVGDHELANLLAERALGVELLAQHIGFLSETEWHGAHRRRLANLHATGHGT
jgi:L-arabinose isomerase